MSFGSDLFGVYIVGFLGVFLLLFFRGCFEEFVLVFFSIYLFIFWGGGGGGDNYFLRKIKTSVAFGFMYDIQYSIVLHFIKV